MLEPEALDGIRPQTVEDDDHDASNGNLVSHAFSVGVNEEVHGLKRSALRVNNVGQRGAGQVTEVRTSRDAER
jgi:hypothetical protein